MYLYLSVTNLTTVRMQGNTRPVIFKARLLQQCVPSWWRHDSHALPSPYASRLLKGYRRREKAIKFEWRNRHSVSETYCTHPYTEQGHPDSHFGRHITAEYNNTHEERQHGGEAQYLLSCTPSLWIVSDKGIAKSRGRFLSLANCTVTWRCALRGRDVYVKLLQSNSMLMF